MAEALLGRGDPLLACLFPDNPLVERDREREREREGERDKQRHEKDKDKEAQRQENEREKAETAKRKGGSSTAAARQRGKGRKVIAFVKRSFGAMVGKGKKKRAATSSRKLRPNARTARGSGRRGATKQKGGAAASGKTGATATATAATAAVASSEPWPAAGGPRYALGYVCEDGDVSRTRLFAEEFVLSRVGGNSGPGGSDSQGSSHGDAEREVAVSAVLDALRATAQAAKARDRVAMGEAELSAEDRAYLDGVLEVEK